MIRTKIFYSIKPFIPRIIQLTIRRQIIKRKKAIYADIWPIDLNSSKKPKGWFGWPNNKKFALILTHDVETAHGLDKCLQLMNIEKNLGFYSSFNFVPLRYEVPDDLINTIKNEGFEVGVHGLKHDGKLYKSEKEFKNRAAQINKFLDKWGAVGFRSPAMHHNLEWIHELHIDYDASTFDTDPFEPQDSGIGTIFPIKIEDPSSKKSYIELPYTLPQDFTLFVLMREKSIDIWKNKLDWIVEHEGMALLNTHPDYMNFDNEKIGTEEYKSQLFIEFLEYVKNKYRDKYWLTLPKNLANYSKKYL